MVKRVDPNSAGPIVADAKIRVAVGLAAVVAPLLHTATDIVEVAQGGFSPALLYVNYVAFLAVPFYVLGLHALQHERAGWRGLAGAVAYSAAFIFYAGTTIYALARKSADYEAMIGELGILYWAHGALMIAGGLAFGAATAFARVLPAWTGALLVFAMFLHLVLAIVPLPEISQAAASAVRNLAFVGMGVAVRRKLPRPA